MKLQSMVKGIAAVAIATAFAGPALADTVKLTNYAFTPAKSIQTSGPSYNGGAGEFVGTLNGNSFATFCTDLAQSFSFNTTYTDYSVVDGVLAWGAAKSLSMDKAISYMLAAGGPTNANNSAAYQAMIWEVLYETSGTFSFTSGTFKASSTNAAAQTALNGINWGAIATQAVTYSVDQLYSPRHQDFLVYAPVPEPESYAMMLAGLGVMGAIARRRTRAAA
ncbi:MAG TPA: PEP-CTERM sorting domain-containing protein [Rhodocyclaceae bacterium]|nr:PEP-CTERM sorting domain-containing protein [Rhodocyclaceae bacterium]HNH34620.1 PEP-CTERM sorting domain-containing protein [Rhodocyclaceae bacterium]